MLPNASVLGVDGKKGWVQSIFQCEKPDVIAMQEIKYGVVGDSWVEELWGNKNFGFAQVEANGKLGGMMMIWDSNSFECKDAMGDNRVLAVKGCWKGVRGSIVLACIYGPQVSSHKVSLWNKLEGLMENGDDEWCIFGDFNVIRRHDDRLNSQVNIKEMEDFNTFINTSQLVEIPMGGRKFTRVSDDGLKFSKLDRFLVTEGFKSKWGNLAVVALDRKLSDHCPIVLKDLDVDFGPKPF